MSHPTADQLIQDHVEYAKALAGKVRRRVRLPHYVDHDELEGWALLGLTQSAQRFDADRGVLFTSFSYRRIVGAVLNGIGKMHDAPESARRRARRMTRTQDALPPAAPAPVAGSANNQSPSAAADELAAAIDRVGATVTVQRLGEWSEPTCDHDPMDDLIQTESLDQLHAAIDRLPEAMQQVIRLYHLDDRTMAEVAEELNISAPTVCRRNREALARLAREMKEPATAETATLVAV